MKNKDKTVFIVLVIALVLVIVGGWYLTSGKEQPTSFKPASTEAIEEDITKGSEFVTTYNITGQPPTCVLDVNVPCEN